MRKRSSSRKRKASPSPMPSLSLPRDSLQSIFNIIATGSARKSKTRGRLHSRINGGNTSGSTPSPASKSLTSIGDLKDFASSQVDDLKRRLDRSHSGISKDVEASHFRLHKRSKMHARAIQQVTDKVDRSIRRYLSRSMKLKRAAKATFMEVMEDAQTSTSHICKTSIPELSQSFDNAIDVLCNRLGVSSS
ncbi:uncharacterized protein J3R85_013719 [Psidium guajava]|nr:uncharacterized protein J3R85_013719 [Psidium guajava]